MKNLKVGDKVNIGLKIPGNEPCGIIRHIIIGHKAVFSDGEENDYIEHLDEPVYIVETETDTLELPESDLEKI